MVCLFDLKQKAYHAYKGRGRRTEVKRGREGEGEGGGREREGGAAQKPSSEVQNWGSLASFQNEGTLFLPILN